MREGLPNAEAPTWWKETAPQRKIIKDVIGEMTKESAKDPAIDTESLRRVVQRIEAYSHGDPSQQYDSISQDYTMLWLYKNIREKKGEEYKAAADFLEEALHGNIKQAGVPPRAGFTGDMLDTIESILEEEPDVQSGVGDKPITTLPSGAKILPFKRPEGTHPEEEKYNDKDIDATREKIQKMG